MWTWKPKLRSRFRATEVLTLCLLALPAVGCEKTTGGTAIGHTAPSTTSTTRLSDPAEPVPASKRLCPITFRPMPWCASRRRIAAP